MKKKILLIISLILLIIIISFLFIGLANRTFFKNYYEVTNLEDNNLKIPLPLFSFYKNQQDNFNVTFNTLRSVKKVKKVLNNYVENLQSCYDESYFYDSNLDITISKYNVEDKFPFNKITLVYSFGNYCENEFILDNNWYKDFNEKAQIQEVVINSCIVEGDVEECNDKTINVSEIDKILKLIYADDVERIDNKNNISIKETNDYQWLLVYYSIDNHAYYLSIFGYDDNYLAFKIIDSNDHPKNAIYNINNNSYNILQNIYNKY